MWPRNTIDIFCGVGEPRRLSKDGISKKCLIDLLLLAYLLFNAYGCTTYHGLRPMNPTVGNPGSPNTVPSLQPVLEWEPSQGTEVTYDVVVVEGLEGGRLYNPGRTVFYRERITENKVKIEPPLVLDSVYWWTVRTRNGDKVSEWSRYDFTGYYVYVTMWTRNYPYPFRTPVNANGLLDDPARP
jgi:hypothetical protein